MPNSEIRTTSLSLPLSVPADQIGCWHIRQDPNQLKDIALHHQNPQVAEAAVYFLMINDNFADLEVVNNHLLDIKRTYESREQAGNFETAQAQLITKHLTTPLEENFVKREFPTSTINFIGSRAQEIDLRLFNVEVIAVYHRIHVRGLWTLVSPEEASVSDQNLQKQSGVVTSLHLHGVLGKYAIVTTMDEANTTTIVQILSTGSRTF